MSGLPRVTMQEIDMSVMVPSFAGVYGAIQVQAKKGPVGKPMLATSDVSFLRGYTPDETVKVGYDLAHYSALAFLEKSKSLWVNRVVNGALFAGAKVTASAINAFAAGALDINAVEMALTDALIIHASNQGAWGNDLLVSITDFATSPDTVKYQGAYLIQVFKKGNLATPVESHIVSLSEGALDGYGQNMYIENVLAGSAYINAVHNTLFEGVLAPMENTALAGGTDGDAVTESNMISAVKVFKNPSDKPVTVLMDGGFATTGYQKELDAIAQYRGDCVAILSMPFSAENSADAVTSVVEYRKATLNLNSSFSAIYSSYLLITDKFNSRDIYVSPDGFVGANISATGGQYDLWYPVAGSKRGMLNVKDVKVRYDEGQAGYLYDRGINPILFIEGEGIMIHGQKTLLNTPSALDRLNVRLLLCVIKPATKAFLKSYLFDLNDEGVRNLIVSKLDVYYGTIQGRKGLDGYKIVCDETNNTPSDMANKTLNVWIFIQPKGAIEYIQCKLIITPTGISFEEVAQAV